MRSQTYIRIVFILGLTIVIQCNLSNTQVEGSPLVQPSNTNDEQEKDLASNEQPHHHVRSVVDQALDLVKGKGNSGSVKADEEEEPEEKKKGLKTMDYVWIGLGCLVAAILLCCIISYLFCACVKEILCLPFTCLKKILCCCCGD